MIYRFLLITLLFLSSSAITRSQMICDFADDSITFCFDVSFQSAAGCSMDTVTSGVYFFSRAEDSMGTISIPSFQNVTGDDGTKMTYGPLFGFYCITLEVTSWYGIPSIDSLERITFAIRNKSGSVFLTNSCINNPFGYYVIKDLNSLSQQIETQGGTDLTLWFNSTRDTVCVDTPIGIQDIIPEISTSVSPNPFSYETSISLDLLRNIETRIYIMDQLGRKIKEFEPVKIAGKHELSWNGKDFGGNAVSNGVYLLVLNVDGKSVTKKMVLMR